MHTHCKKDFKTSRNIIQESVKKWKYHLCINYSIQIAELHKTIFGVGSAHSLHSDPSFPAQLLQIYSSTDTSQMTECLRSITHLFARDGHFFREHAQVVRVGQDVVEVREREFPNIGNWDVISGSL